MNRIVVFLLILVALGARASNVQSTGPDELRLLTSIQPLTALTRAIIGDRSRVDTLLALGTSPHHFALRVSDVRRLRRAQLVIWVGSALERPLGRALAGVDASKTLALMELEGLHWPAAANPRDDHDHGGLDPHIWLDPRNGIVIANAIAARLAQLQPQAADVIRRRADRLIDEITRMDSDLHQRFSEVRGKGFVTYHDGYGHFVQAYGLNQLGFISRLPDRRPGARHLHQLRQNAAGAACLVADSAYKSGHAVNIAAQWGLELVTLEPFGRAEDTYPELITRLAERFYQCLEP